MGSKFPFGLNSIVQAQHSSEDVVVPKEKINNLMTELHHTFGLGTTSEQQKKLLEELNAHVHDVNEEAPIDPTPVEIIETMLENLGEEHPKASLLLRQLLDTLKNIGV